MLVNKPEVDKAWSPGQHTGTFRGQGFSFVAGKIGLEYFKNEQFNEETKRKGDIVRKVLDKLNSKYEKVVDVRQKGLMLAIEFDSAATVKEITAKTYENGLIIGACSTGEIIKFIPPLTITDEELNKGLERFTASVEAILS
jgi:diaminobutyrate-2-oxoglutarate transaminase